MIARSRRTCGLPLRTVFGVLLALGFAGCSTAPPQPPIEHALAVSAEQGNPRAQVDLGIRMLAQAHTPEERATAVKWIRSAADANLALGQARLGWMYLTGKGVPQDTSRALKWLRLAANRGAPAAQLQLAQIYATGTLVPLDKAQAYYWYSVAAKPARSDVTIFNIVQVRFFAQMRAQSLADSLTAAQKQSVGEQVAAWAPAASVPYSAAVSLKNLMR